MRSVANRISGVMSGVLLLTGAMHSASYSAEPRFEHNGRVDADLTHKDRLSFALYWVPLTTTNFNGPIRSQNFWHHDQLNFAYSLIWNHTISSTLLNQARANAAGWRWNEVSSNPQAPFGLPQDNIDAIGSSVGATPATPQAFGAPGPSDFNWERWRSTKAD